MKNRIAIFLLALFGSTASAADFTCNVPQNLDHGYSFEFAIKISPLAIGSQILATRTTGDVYLLGKVDDLSTLQADNPQDRSIFKTTLSLISGVDVSGLSAADLASVTSLQVVRSYTSAGDETLLILPYGGTQILGGTIRHGGEGTACLQPAGRPSP